MELGLGGGWGGGGGGGTFCELAQEFHLLLGAFTVRNHQLVAWPVQVETVSAFFCCSSGEYSLKCVHCIDVYRLAANGFGISTTSPFNFLSTILLTIPSDTLEERKFISCLCHFVNKSLPFCLRTILPGCLSLFFEHGGSSFRFD